MMSLPTRCYIQGSKTLRGRTKRWWTQPPRQLVSYAGNRAVVLTPVSLLPSGSSGYTIAVPNAEVEDAGERGSQVDLIVFMCTKDQ